MVILALLMLGCCNPIVVVLGLVAAYELVKRSGRVATLNMVPSEVTKLAQMKDIMNSPKLLRKKWFRKWFHGHILPPEQTTNRFSTTFRTPLPSIMKGLEKG